ncbi:hypothetical protein Tco_1500176 [Tanacetum coccineum]
MLQVVRLCCPAISRLVEFCYSNPARLYYYEHTLQSCQGVHQGDPLGRLLFALVLHPLICKIRDSFSLSLQAWYLDDGTIIGDTLVVGKVLELIMKDRPSRGLHLNIDKTEIAAARLQTKLLRHSGIVAFGPTFDDALCVSNTKMETNLLSNPSEIAAPKLMKKLANIYFTCVTQTTESTFSLSPRHIALWQSQMEDHTSDLLRVVLIFRLGQTINEKDQSPIAEADPVILDGSDFGCAFVVS